MHRYLAASWNPDDRNSAARAASLESALLEADERWEIAFRIAGLSVLHVPPVYGRNIHPLEDESGVVIGSLFRRNPETHSSSPAIRLDQAESRRIVASAGRHLLEHYWGSYAAFVYDARSRSRSVLRDPTANLACYHAKWSGLHIFFSDIVDLKRYVPMPLSVNWRYIASMLLFGEQLSRECALAEIEDIPGGEWLCLSAQSETRTTLWHPATFCVGEALEDEIAAANSLRSAVLDAVHTLASQHSEVLLRLSGGLDSSVVASCLAQHPDGPHVTCLNFYISSGHSDQPTGPIVPGLNAENRAKLLRIIGGADEREFARRVAHKHGLCLLERERRVDDYPFEAMWNIPLTPRPSTHMLVLDADQIELACATERGATACFTGEAGDTIFYNTLRAIGALDYAYLHPLGAQLLPHIALTAKLSGESVARISGKVLKYGLLRAQLPSPLDPLSRPHLLKDETAASTSLQPFRHPWVDGAPRLCPGKRNHVLGVALSVPNYHHVYHSERVATSVHPLASQPVVETCLRIPTYVLLAGGVSRGLARYAFRDLLPPEIVRRTVKGYALSFWQRVIRHNVGFIRQCMLEGTLVRQGILDRAKLENYLVEDQPFLSVQPQQILRYLGCEAWLRQWTS